MVINIPTKIKKVDKIFHIADIHIRNYIRHGEYEEVFQRLYSYIKENSTENSIIYIAGDIVHTKTDISPELVFVLSKFLSTLASICPTLLILGNHDINLKNNSRLNIIKPLVDLLDNENLTLLEGSQYYRFAQLGISVFGMDSDPVDFPLAKGLDTEVKIAFFHGAVTSSVMEQGVSILSSNIKIEHFDGYHLALLGDIHNRQLLQRYQQEEKEIDESELEYYLQNGWELL